MSTPAIIALVAAAVIVVGMLAVFFFFACYVTLPKNSLERSIQWEKNHNFYRDFDTREVKEYEIRSFDGYILHAYFVPNRDFPESRKFIIINHGYTSSHYGALKYFNKWTELGFQCVLYDDRYHGKNLKNRKSCSTLGIREAKDMMAVVEDTYMRYGNDIYLGLQGESMGSAMEITALKYKPKVHFIVNDCGFADLLNVLEGALKAQFHLHKWLIWPSSFAMASSARSSCVLRGLRSFLVAFSVLSTTTLVVCLSSQTVSRVAFSKVATGSSVVMTCSSGTSSSSHGLIASATKPSFLALIRHAITSTTTSTIAIADTIAIVIFLTPVNVISANALQITSLAKMSELSNDKLSVLWREENQK